MYGIMLINNPDEIRLMHLNKYWVLFGVFNLIDGLFSFILGYIPGYYYLKLVLIYFLIRNDFYWSSYSYDLLNSYYVQFAPMIDSYFAGIMKTKQLNSMAELYKTD